MYPYVKGRDPLRESGYVGGTRGGARGRARAGETAPRPPGARAGDRS